MAPTDHLRSMTTNTNIGYGEIKTTALSSDLKGINNGAVSTNFDNISASLDHDDNPARNLSITRNAQNRAPDIIIQSRERQNNQFSRIPDANSFTVSAEFGFPMGVTNTTEKAVVSQRSGLIEEADLAHNYVTQSSQLNAISSMKIPLDSQACLSRPPQQQDSSVSFPGSQVHYSLSAVSQSLPTLNKHALGDQLFMQSDVGSSTISEFAAVNEHFRSSVHSSPRPFAEKDSHMEIQRLRISSEHSHGAFELSDSSSIEKGKPERTPNNQPGYLPLVARSAIRWYPDVYASSYVPSWFKVCVVISTNMDCVV